MTEQINDIESALKKVKDQKENFGFMDRFTVDENWEVTKALEKQIPKKPMLLKFDHYDSYFCKCGLGFGNSIMMIRPQYCNNCGQKLDWGNENDRD